ncbi:GAF domain-containing sensor histidine kinase [Crossiella cryophila]|uniref:histidine kinase n=1 Tax=Crossiella cryophila TaxID=43355 RepID=A0A7W7CAW3_9PSEU|nr:ATP-binding protein [Crossiella cryophila]MBB4677771.1 signal transduction histidine kinase [Crossiella cryophila]
MTGKDWPIRLLATAAGLSLLITIPVTLFLLPARLTLSWALTAVLPCYAAGLLVWRAAPSHPVGRRLMVFGSLLAIGLATNYPLHFLTTPQDWQPAGFWVWFGSTGNETLEFVFNILIIYLVALLPDGGYRHRYERILLRSLWFLLPAPLIAALAGLPIEMMYLWSQKPFAWLHVGAGIMLLIRCLLARRDGRPQPWLTSLAILTIAIMLARAVLLLTRDWRVDIDEGWYYVIGRLIGTLPYSLVPVIVVVAALRRQLLGVDIVVPRSVVYGLLWLVIGCWYLGTATMLGWTAGQYLPVGLVALVTATAMLLFQPLRAQLNQAAARRVYGPRLTGFELLVQFGTTLEHAYDLPRLAPHLASSLQSGLNLKWARVELGGAAHPCSPPVVSVAGTVTEEAATRFPLRHAEEQLGVIEYGPKVEGRFTPEDHALVESLARQAALAVHNANLAKALGVQVEQVSRQASELEASRTRIVQAQDTERRRIERQLHDGIQQELVALVAKLRLARNQFNRGGEAAGNTLTEVQDDAYRVIDELRELAHGIHPPVLTDQGLIAAVTSRARRLPIPVTVDCPPDLRAARFGVDVEESAFFLISEALTNVLKHAGAGAVTIHFGHLDGELIVDVRDDGRGFRHGGGGLGLTGMRDRAEAVGGALTIASTPGAGTTITARLPAAAREPSTSDRPIEIVENTADA